MFFRLLVWRTSRRRSAPCSASARATWLPRKPVAPVTKASMRVYYERYVIRPHNFANLNSRGFIRSIQQGAASEYSAVGHARNSRVRIYCCGRNEGLGLREIQGDVRERRADH